MSSECILGNRIGPRSTSRATNYDLQILTQGTRLILIRKSGEAKKPPFKYFKQTDKDMIFGLAHSSSAVQPKPYQISHAYQDTRAWLKLRTVQLIYIWTKPSILT